MNPWRPPLSHAVYSPLPYLRLPAPISRVDEAIVRRVVAGLERLTAQHRQPTTC